MDYTEAINSAPAVLVEFYASWCPHCQAMMPVVDDIKALLEGKLEVFQLDVQVNEQLADIEKVKSLPTFILYRDGRPVMRETGEMPAEVLLSKIQSHI